MADGRMRIGVVLPIAQEDVGGQIASYPTLRAIAVAAEGAGFDSVWVFDHLLFRDIASLDPCTEENVAAFAEAVALLRAG
jgi:alkanesulfonate monooxygenase SsuD/methylene tetrahydromethanopterin reductase-like flavin-dependent oxidoreductase (luciferase family)